MKSLVCASLLMFSLLSLPSAPTASAQIGEPAAAGHFRFSAGDDLTKSIEFSAAAARGGGAEGGMVFRGPAIFPNQDVDGEEKAGFDGRLSDLLVEAKWDCIVVEKNRAVMSGVVTASTLGEYIGLRVLLVVEDNGDGTDPKAQDKFTWGLYKPAAEGWVPTDAERKDDDGALLRWTATDAERDDDKGIPSHPSKVVGCQNFAVSSYELLDVTAGDGDLRVRS